MPAEDLRAASCVFSPAAGLELPRQRTAGPSSPPQEGPAPRPPWKKSQSFRDAERDLEMIKSLLRASKEQHLPVQCFIVC